MLWFVLGPGGLRQAPGGPGKAYGGLSGRTLKVSDHCGTTPKSGQNRSDSLCAGLWAPCLVFRAWFGPALVPNPVRNRRLPAGSLKVFGAPLAQLSPGNPALGPCRYRSTGRLGTAEVQTEDLSREGPQTYGGTFVTGPTLCYAIVLPGREAGFRVGFRPDSSRESLKIGPPAGGLILRLSRIQSCRNLAREVHFWPGSCIASHRVPWSAQGP